jgi:hypothetical protein
MSKPIVEVAILEPDTAIPPAELKVFVTRSEESPEFSFSRYWWLGEGARWGITGWVGKKLAPGDDPVFGKAARHEILLPDAAPSDYADVAFTLARFDQQLPPHEKHVMVHVKVALPRDEPWHAGYERVRAYARSHFVKMGHPVVLVAHVPHLACCEGATGSHIHCIALSRTLGLNGFEAADYLMCSDKGYAAALAAWQLHFADEA